MKKTTLCNLSLVLLLSLSITACGSGSDTKKVTPTPAPTPAPTLPSNTELAEVIDESMFAQIKRAMDAIETKNIWPEYKYKDVAHYMVRTENKNAVTAFVINPQSKIDGAQVVGKNENKGLNVVKFEGQMNVANDKLKTGNGIYDFDYKIANKDYYLQAYSKENTLDNGKESPELIGLSTHEVFHDFQRAWTHPSDYVQKESDYPLTKELLELQLLTLEIFKDFPNNQNKDQLKEALKQYVAIKTEEIKLDPSAEKLVKNMGLGQELFEGTARYVETLAIRAGYEEQKNRKFADIRFEHVKDIKSKQTLRQTFAFGIFYSTGANVTYLLKQAGYSIADLKSGKYPYDAARELLNMTEVETNEALARAKKHASWGEIQKVATRLVTLP